MIIFLCGLESPQIYHRSKNVGPDSFFTCGCIRHLAVRFWEIHTSQKFEVRTRRITIPDTTVPVPAGAAVSGNAEIDQEMSRFEIDHQSNLTDPPILESVNNMLFTNAKVLA